MKLRMTIDGLSTPDAEREPTDEERAAAFAVILRFLHGYNPEDESSGALIVELDTDAGTLVVVQPDAG